MPSRGWFESLIHVVTSCGPMAKSLEEEEPSTSGSCVRVRGQIGVLPYGNDRLAHVCTAAKGDATIPTSDEPTLTEPARSPKASPRAVSAEW